MEWKCNVTAVSLLKLWRAPVTSMVWCQMVVLSLSFSHYGVGIISNMFYSMGSWKQSSSAWWTPSVLSASVMSTCCNLFILICFFCCCCFFLPEQPIKRTNRSVCFSSLPPPQQQHDVNKSYKIADFFHSLRCLVFMRVSSPYREDAWHRWGSSGWPRPPPRRWAGWSPGWQTRRKKQGRHVIGCSVEVDTKCSHQTAKYKTKMCS